MACDCPLIPMMDRLQGENHELQMRVSRLTDSIHDVMNRVTAIDGRLDDPHGDGSGIGATPPTGDDYNDVIEILKRLPWVAPPKPALKKRAFDPVEAARADGAKIEYNDRGDWFILDRGQTSILHRAFFLNEASAAEAYCIEHNLIPKYETA